MRSPDTDVERIEGLLRGMPPESEREAHIEGLVRELRSGAPAAPRELRERVRGLKPAAPRRQFGWKPVLVVVPVAVALVGAAVLGTRGPTGDEEQGAAGQSPSGAREVITQVRPQSSESEDSTGLTMLAPSTTRAQEWDVRLQLAVRDNARLSEASAEAIATTRALGGYVVSSNVGTHEDGGRAELVMRIPQRRVQDAIAQLSALGTITDQQVSVQDRQGELDRLAARIDSLRVRIAELNVRLRTETLDEAERLRLELQRRRLQSTLNQHTRRRAGVADQVAFADVALTIETRRAAAAGPGRFDGAVDDALAVLSAAAAVALFVAIVIAPLAVILGLAFVVRRAWRRRDDERLLDRPRPTPPVGSR